MSSVRFPPIPRTPCGAATGSDPAQTAKLFQVNRVVSLEPEEVLDDGRSLEDAEPGDGADGG